MSGNMDNPIANLRRDAMRFEKLFKEQTGAADGDTFLGARNAAYLADVEQVERDGDGNPDRLRRAREIFTEIPDPAKRYGIYRSLVDKLDFLPDGDGVRQVDYTNDYEHFLIKAVDLGVDPSLADKVRKLPAEERYNVSQFLWEMSGGALR